MGDQVGQQNKILPSSFIGGPRHMHQLYQDAMAVVRKLGKPDLFVTFTSNPKWQEIQEALLPGQKPADRPDIVSRVFRLKLDALLDDLVKKGVLGRVIGHIHVVEFQKRGLPHAHILLILAVEDKLRCCTDYDQVITTHLPDPNVEPELHKIIATNMLHVPCGTANPSNMCMKDKKCTKNYPRPFCHETKDSAVGYPVYQRPDNGRTVQKAVNHGGPCQPRMRHSVEHCATVRSVKYLYKYVYKGHDRAQVAFINKGPQGQIQDVAAIVAPRDEIAEYLDGRYVGACKAIWRLFSFHLHEQGPHVQRLAMHLDGQLPVTFEDTSNIDQVVASEPPQSTLTAWFKLNQDDQSTRQHLYHDIPQHYVFNTKDKLWTKRQRQGPMCIPLPAVCRMYFVHPSAGEKLFLRVLLCHVREAASFEDLRTVQHEGQTVICSTFCEAARRHGLLQDDNEYHDCLDEAISCSSAGVVRSVFTMLLSHHSLTDPLAMWEKYKQHMINDFLLEVATSLDVQVDDLSAQNVKMGEHRALRQIQRELKPFKLTLQDFNLPVPAGDSNDPDLSLVQMHMQFNREALQQRVDASHSKMNSDQRDVFEAVLQADRANGGIVLPAASSCIAALLMEGGSTAHSLFKIPVDIGPDVACNMSLQSQNAELLKAASLIVWDEAPMAHKHSIEAVDATSRDILGSIRGQEWRRMVPFGGKFNVFAGDFRQILPVVSRGTLAAIVAACLKMSKLWQHIQVRRLTINMRVEMLKNTLGPAAAESQQ
eukprot:gene27610-7247_t